MAQRRKTRAGCGQAKRGAFPRHWFLESIPMLAMVRFEEIDRSVTDRVIHEA